jgi:two-component system sensor histidine kinase FlrB
MLPSSHAVQIMSLGVEPLPSPQLLADAFSEFIAASSVLESSYRDLQQEVARLGSELSERNAALTRSLGENDRMRAALQQMLDSLPCGVLVLNQADRIVMINPEGRRLLELKNAHIESLQALSAFCQIDFVSMGKRSTGPIDIELNPDGRVGNRWLAISCRQLDPAAGCECHSELVSRLQSIWILRDITANKLAEQEREAARRATVLAEISTILAHEIKNPLASLELFAGLIEQEPSEAAEWISHLRAGIRTLSGTVNNVLSLNSECRLRLTSVRLAACIESGVEFVRPIADQAGVSLTYSGSAAAISVLGNEDALRQIILNILCNAIRHTESGGRITVSLAQRTKAGLKRAVIAIQDTGCGMPENVVAHIFDPGFSGTGETPGLGLAVCKRLMDQHSGEIRVSSQVNEGTSFELGFPAI